MQKALLVLLLASLLSGCVATAPEGDDGTGPATPSAPPPMELAASASDALFRPGMAVNSPVANLPGLQPGGSCTANFLFRSPSNGTYYFGTAAHCADGDLGSLVYLEHTGWKHVGMARLVYNSVLADGTHDAFEDCGTNQLVALEDGRQCWNDFALLELDAGNASRSHPSMRQYGGPTAGMASPAAGDQAYTVGSSAYRAGNGLPDARPGVVVEAGQWHALVDFAVPGTQGDSGSPVVDAEGRPLGVLNYLLNVPPGTNGVGLLAPMLAAAAEHGWVVEVVPGDPFEPVPV